MTQSYSHTGSAISNLGATLFDIGSDLHQKREKAKSSIAKYIIGAQIPEEVNRIYQRSLKNSDANAGLKEFQNDFVGLAKGIMSSVPEGEDQFYAGRLLAHSAQQKTNHLEEAAHNQNENVAKYHIAQAIDKYQDMASQAALDGDLNTALSHQASAAKILFDGVKKGFFTSGTAHSLQKQLKESITKNLYFGHGIKLAKTGDAAGLEKAAQDVLNDKTLSHASKTSLLALMSKMKSAYDIQAGLGEESTEELKKEMVFQATNHGKQPTAEQTIFLQSLKPKKAMEIKHAVTDGLEIHNAVQRQKGMPLDKKAEYLELLDKQIAGAGSVRENEIYKKAKELVKKEIDTLINDPVSYVMQLGEDNGIEQELKKLQNTPEFQKLDLLGQEEALKQRKAFLMIQLQKQLGVEPRLLSDEKAQLIVKELQTAGFGNGISHLQKELDSYGSYASVILKDLEKSNLPFGLRYTLNASPEYMPVMIKAFNANLKELEEAAAIGDQGKYLKKEIINDIREDISDYVDTLHLAKNKSHEAMELEQAMYMSALQELSEGHNLKKAIDNAASGIYGHKYQEIDGGIRIPKIDENGQKINISDVEKAKEKFGVDSFFDFQKTNDVYFDGWEEHDDKYNKQLVYDGRWVSSADDSGIFYITSHGRRVYRKSNKKPFFIRFSEAGNLANRKEK